MRTFAETIHKASLAAAHGDAEPWAVLQCHAITGNLRFPSPAELRCMTNISLATGNKAIFWFLYQSEWLNKEKSVEMPGLVDRDFKSSDRWGRGRTFDEANQEDGTDAGEASSVGCSVKR